CSRSSAQRCSRSLRDMAGPAGCTSATFSSCTTVLYSIIASTIRGARSISPAGAPSCSQTRSTSHQLFDPDRCVTTRRGLGRAHFGSNDPDQPPRSPPGILRDDLPVGEIALFRRAFLGREIDVDDAEAALVALQP